MDDILIFSKNSEQHLQRIEDVLQRLSNVNIKLKLTKCKFFVKEVKFLGYQVTENGMSMNEDKTRAIKNMPHPENKKQLQAFLGVCNYFRLFVKNFAQTAEPLYALLKKGVKYEWNDKQREAVERLKQKLGQAPIVKFPDFKKPFHIYTDASQKGIGAVLMQEHEGTLHPLSYVSKTISQAQKNYSTTKLEAMALVFALEQFRCIILQFPVHVYTDHMPLVGIVRKPTKDACLTRWSLLIQEYEINLHYLPGKDNLFADALSRLSDVKDGCERIEDEFDNKLIDRLHYCNTLNEYIPEKSHMSETELRNQQKSDEKSQEIRKQLENDSGVSEKKTNSLE